MTLRYFSTKNGDHGIRTEDVMNPPAWVIHGFFVFNARRNYILLFRGPGWSRLKRCCARTTFTIPENVFVEQTFTSMSALKFTPCMIIYVNLWFLSFAVIYSDTLLIFDEHGDHGIRPEDVMIPRAWIIHGFFVFNARWNYIVLFLGPGWSRLMRYH